MTILEKMEESRDYEASSGKEVKQITETLDFSRYKVARNPRDWNS